MLPAQFNVPSRSSLCPTYGLPTPSPPRGTAPQCYKNHLLVSLFGMPDVYVCPGILHSSFCNLIFFLFYCMIWGESLMVHVAIFKYFYFYMYSTVWMCKLLIFPIINGHLDYYYFISFAMVVMLWTSRTSLPLYDACVPVSSGARMLGPKCYGQCWAVFK